MIRLSVIIPAFNVQSWIRRCLDSCLTQNISSDFYEVIIVNDGSTDDSKLIAEEYCNLYPNVKLISKENGGLSSARNAGLKTAVGQYVFFLDADDWVSESSFSRILELTEGTPDVISIGYNLVHKDRIETLLPYCDSGKDLLKSHNYPMGAPFWILNRDFVVKYGLFFKEGIFHEDNEFTPKVLYLASHIKTLAIPVYNYFIQESGTIISSKNIKKSYDLLKIVDSYVKFVDAYVDKSDEYLFREHSMLAFNACCANARMCSKDEKQKLYESIISNDDLIRYVFLYNGYKRVKYLFEALIGRFFTRLFLKFIIR